MKVQFAVNKRCMYTDSGVQYSLVDNEQFLKISGYILIIPSIILMY